MSWILLGNDDGVDSPALVPFADALEQALDLPVRIAVPAGERSWSSKAVTRRGTVHTEALRRDGRSILAVDGTPADAIQLGLYSLFGQEFGGSPPRAVVTGINLGYNAGTAFLASSGTVWAAAEAAFAGLPAIAFSTGPTATSEDFASWRSASLQPDARPRWSVLAEVAAAVTQDLGDATLLDHCDLVSVNMPWDATPTSGRAVTSLTPLAYGPLFVPDGGDTGAQGAWNFTTELDIHVGDPVGDGPGDLAALRDGDVAITPVVLPRSAQVPAAARTELDRPRQD